MWWSNCWKDPMRTHSSYICIICILLLHAIYGTSLEYYIIYILEWPSKLWIKNSIKPHWVQYILRHFYLYVHTKNIIEYAVLLVGSGLSGRFMIFISKVTLIYLHHCTWFFSYMYKKSLISRLNCMWNLQTFSLAMIDTISLHNCT